MAVDVVEVSGVVRSGGVVEVFVGVVGRSVVAAVVAVVALVSGSGCDVLEALRLLCVRSVHAVPD